MNDEITYEVDGLIATITINRPESHNSLTPLHYVEMERVFKSAGNDPSVKCIVLTGKGKAFSSGAYLAPEELETTFAPEALRNIIINKLNPLVKSITDNQKPVIAAINGPCAGASAGIALACDLIIASESAYLLFPFVNIGLVPDGGPVYFLTRLVGQKKAMEFLLLGEKITAAQALELGLFNRVIPSEVFEKEVKTLAEKLAQGPYSQSLIKNMVNRSFEMTLDAYLDMEAAYQPKAAKSVDAKEGINAFIQKRKPQFSGR